MKDTSSVREDNCQESHSVWEGNILEFFDVPIKRANLHQQKY